MPPVVQVPEPTYVPVPHQLTDPIPAPQPPAASCVLGNAPAVCVSQALAWIEAWEGKLQQANDDRATTARIAGQPAPTSSTAGP